MNIVCAVCGKKLEPHNCVRIGGLIEQITGNRFMCPDCVSNVHGEAVQIVIDRKDEHDGTVDVP